jgi:hypothetical protein
MSIQQVKLYDTICEAKLLAPNTWTVDQVFSPSTLEWLQEIWVDEKNEFQVSRPHRRLLLKPGADHQRLQQIGLDMIPALSQLVGIDLNLMVVKYWLDLPGFGCQIHHDSPEIIVSLQIYINTVDQSGDQPCHGVEFLHMGEPYEVDIRPNHGYINLNTDLKLHRVVPGMGTRTSVMFQFNRV